MDDCVHHMKTIIHHQSIADGETSEKKMKLFLTFKKIFILTENDTKGGFGIG